jgi:hypothetical protein
MLRRDAIDFVGAAAASMVGSRSTQMMDCTRVRCDGRRRLRPVTALALALALGLGWSLAAPPARGDGDPASDVLATQSLFLPQDAGIPVAQQAQLQALLQEAAKGGFQLRLALIASPSDLGSIGELWRQPAAYASFLGQELSLLYRGDLLVIMPDGFGLYERGHPVEARALSTVPIGRTGARLASTAMQAVQALAGGGLGHPLALPRPGVTGSAGGTDGTPWLVFGLGLVAMALAWAASLRARPLTVRRRNLPAS